MIDVTLNGEARTLAAGTTVAALLEQLGVRTALVAVERNRAIVPKDAFASTVLAAGDRVEVLRLVGGG